MLLQLTMLDMGSTWKSRSGLSWRPGALQFKDIDDELEEWTLQISTIWSSGLPRGMGKSVVLHWTLFCIFAHEADSATMLPLHYERA